MNLVIKLSKKESPRKLNFPKHPASKLKGMAVIHSAHPEQNEMVFVCHELAWEWVNGSTFTDAKSFEIIQNTH